MKTTRILFVLLLAVGLLWTPAIGQTVLTQGFENGLGDWQAVSMNTNNNTYFGITSQNTTAHSGSFFFQFSSYYSASDYNQYLISPRMELQSAARMVYYCIKSDGQGNESFQVMVSTTDSNIASFSVLGSTIYPTNSWTEQVTTLPAGTRFVAFKYTANYQYMTGIDDIAICIPSTTPEMSLTSVDIPHYMSAGTTATVGGTVVNLCSQPLTNFTVDYTLGASTTTFNVTGINVAQFGTHTFSHTITTGNATGEQLLTVAVKLPNGVADDTTDNSMGDTVTMCTVINTLPYTQSFEQGMDCWQAVSATTINNNRFGITSTSSHQGDNCFRFSSYSSTSDYTQFLISPELNLDAQTGLSFYGKDLYGNGTEKIQLMLSTTDADTASFTAYGPVITLAGSWRRYDTLIPATTRYVAFKYVSRYQYYCGIDDIELTPVPSTPEVALTHIELPYMVGNNTAFSIGGTVENHSATPLTEVDMAYVIGGDTTSTHLTGFNIGYMQEYTFTLPAPAIIATAGTHTVTLIASMPNGVADNTADNAMSGEVQVYLSSNTTPRKVLMEHFSTASCPNCYDGHVRIETALAQGYEDDVIHVTHHAGYYTDALTISASETLTTFYNDHGNTYAPAVMLDRTYLGDHNFTHGAGVPPGPVFYPHTDFADALAVATTLPAYVSVGFSDMSYDSTSRQVAVTVSGEVTGTLDALSPRLNLWLLEDSILADGGSGPGHGPTQGYAPTGFTHDNVLRAVVSSNVWGDENIVATAAGSTFSHTYTYTVPNNCIAEQCYLVAFVSEGNHSNLNNCRVYNAAKSNKLTATPDTTVHDTTSAPDTTHTVSLQLTHNGIQLHDGDTIVVETTSSATADTYVGYANTGNRAMQFRVWRETLSSIDGAIESFCIYNMCYGGNASGPIPLTAGQSIGEEEHDRALHLSYTSPMEGDAMVRYTFRDIEDSANTVGFIIKYVVSDPIGVWGLALIHDDTLHPGDTIVVTTHNDNAAHLYVGYANTGDNALRFTVAQHRITMAPGAMASFSINGEYCNGDASEPVTLEGGESVSEEDHQLAFHATFVTTEGGESLIRYTFVNVNNYNDSVSFMVRYTATSTQAITQSNILTFSIYPVPATDRIYIDGLNGGSDYSIYTAVGTKIATGITEGYVDITTIPAGWYIIELQTDEHAHRLKFIKE